MEIIRVEHAGFCFGVSNAVQKAHEAAAKYKGVKPIYSLGKIIHNDTVVADLEKEGVITAEGCDQIPDGAAVLIRAHGVAPDVYKTLEEKGCEIIDATCPNVSKIHDKVKQYYSEGCRIVICGDKTHPEVKGINGMCDGTAVVVKTAEEAENAFEKFFTREEKVCLVAQTTFNVKIFEKITDLAKKIFDKCFIFDTICFATSTRQQETEIISKDVELMIVVGGRESSNTRKLFEISSRNCNSVFMVESAAELDMSRIVNYSKVGVTAGASTPESVIEEVIVTMSMENPLENNEVENVVSEAAEAVKEEAVAEVEKAEEAVETAVTEEAEKAVETACEVKEDVAECAKEAAEEAKEAVEETTKAADEQAESFETMLEESLKTLTNGEVVKGAITKIDSKGVYIDLGFKYEGFIAIDEFKSIGKDEEPDIKIGDEVEAVVVKVSDKDCEVVLSKRRVDYKKETQALEDSFNNKTPIEVTVTEAVKGGVIAHLGSSRIFIPQSQLDVRFIRDPSTYVGKNLEVIITSYEKGQKGRTRIVASRRVIIEEARKASSDAFWSDAYEGQVRKGVVKSFTPFGAFVDLGGIDGLIHITELSWKRIRRPQDVLKEGQEVEVRIIGLDREKNKISLGYRKPEDDPWFDAENLYQVGDVKEVEVARFAPFGVFVNLAKDIDGLVHISQISNKRITSADQVLEIGQKVMAKIVDVDIPKHKISLSIKDVKAYDPEPTADEIAAEMNGEDGEKKQRRQRRNRKGENSEEEEFKIENTSSATSIADILEAKKKD